jgi:DNA modification methylase
VTIRILEGHILDVLSREEAGSVHTVVTSPPYWKLRAYGTPPQVWPDGWMGELGQEDDPETYITHLVDVFAAVRRVLRDDGSLWINLAGAYWSDPGGQNGSQGTVSAKAVAANAQQGRQKRGRHPWLKPLDWVDVPGLFAHAMQAAGWLWRSDVTWIKPSALPESVSGTRWERCKGEKVKAGATQPGYGGATKLADPTAQYDVGRAEKAEWADCPGCPRCAPTQGYVLRRGNGRPTKSTERVLLFAKKPGYFFDSEAVREPGSLNSHGGAPLPERGPKHQETHQGGPGALGVVAAASGRNLRDWWVLSPEPLSDAHYAAYPTTLPTRCIKAGTSERGCCPVCGSPWARVVETRSAHVPAAGIWKDKPEYLTDHQPRQAGAYWNGERWVSPSFALPESTTLGWRQTCRCPGHEPVPCTVLDPFAGSGTTLIAADRLGRDAVGVELKSQYVAMAQRRVTGDAPLLLWGAVTVEADTTGSVPEAVPLLLEEPEDAVAGG